MSEREQASQLINRGRIPVVPVAYPVDGRGNGLFSEAGEPSVRLAHCLSVLSRHRWKIPSFIAVCTFATGFISTRLTPIYESTATIDVDRHTPVGIIGQESA